MMRRASSQLLVLGQRAVAVALQDGSRAPQPSCWPRRRVRRSASRRASLPQSISPLARSVVSTKDMLGTDVAVAEKNPLRQADTGNTSSKSITRSVSEAVKPAETSWFGSGRHSPTKPIT